MSGRRHASRAAAASALAVVAVLVAGPEARAHAELVATAPGPGESLTEAPTEITLTFSEELLDAGADVLVSARNTPSQETAVSEPFVDGDVVSVALEGLDDGEYEVRWRVVSADGHPVFGAFSFAVGQAVPQVPESPAAPSTDPDRSAASAEGQAIDPGLVARWAGALTLVAGAVVGVVWWLAGRRRRRSSERA